MPLVFHLALVDWTTMTPNERDTSALGRLNVGWLTRRKTLQKPRCVVNMTFRREKPHVTVILAKKKRDGTVNSRRMREGEMNCFRLLRGNRGLVSHLLVSLCLRT